jgi:hypothetical protein
MVASRLVELGDKEKKSERAKKVSARAENAAC